MNVARLSLFVCVLLLGGLLGGCPSKPEAGSEPVAGEEAERQRPGAPSDGPTAPAAGGEAKPAPSGGEGAPSGSPAPSAASEKEAVLKAEKARQAAWSARDLNKVMSFYAPSVLATRKGREDMDTNGLRHLLREEFTAVEGEGNFTIDAAWADRAMAVVLTTRITRVGGKGVRDRGVAVWRRGEGGAWRIHRAIQYRDQEEGPGRITAAPLPSFDLATIADPKERALAKEVQAASERIYGAYEVLDLGKMGELIAEDALFLFPGRPDRGKAASLRDLSQLAAAKATITADHGVEEIMASEGLAVVRFVIKQSAQIPKRGALKSTERGADVWRKDAGGAWRIVGSAQYAFAR